MPRGGGGGRGMKVLKLEAWNFSSPLASGSFFRCLPVLLVLKYTNFRSPTPPPFFQSPPFRSLKIFGAPPQYLHPPPLVIPNELSLKNIDF